MSALSIQPIVFNSAVEFHSWCKHHFDPVLVRSAIHNYGEVEEMIEKEEQEEWDAPISMKSLGMTWNDFM